MNPLNEDALRFERLYLERGKEIETLRSRVSRMEDLIRAELNYCPFCSKGAFCRAPFHDKYRAALDAEGGSQ